MGFFTLTPSAHLYSYLAPAHIVGVREKAAVLGTIGELAQVGGEGVASFIPQLLVLIIDGVRVGSTRDVAIVTMGQLIESTGFVIRPFNEHPGLLSLMLRVLAEETGPVRAELLRTLGVLGALDPHAHRENEERIHGQGLLSMEGVRGVGRAHAHVAQLGQLGQLPVPARERGARSSTLGQRPDAGC